MSLPVPSPTQSYWETPPHRLAAYCSPFPKTADVVIIGSGITGSSVARTLLEHNPSLKVVIVEARTLCSGATGRNGGQLAPGMVHPSFLILTLASYQAWYRRVEKLGVEESILITRFENSHRSVIASIVEQYNLRCDLRQLDCVDAYYDKHAFEDGTAAVRAISMHVPELVHRIFSANEAYEQLRVSKDCVGAITYPAAQLWPYKFVTQIVEQLLDLGMNLQTQTPVIKVWRFQDKSAWIVETTRGKIVTTNVVHATNGYVQYLLPELTPIVPARGLMTAQKCPESLSDPPLDHLYLFLGGRYDYLIQQPAYDGNTLILGGAFKQDVNAIGTYDDAEVPEIPLDCLCTAISKVLQWEEEEKSDERLEMSWSGIMGFSRDGLPWVGPLSENIGGGEGQWICAGYTGEGTVF